MTSPVELPLFGKVKLFETSKTELLELWNKVLTQNEIKIDENTKVNSVEKVNELLKVNSTNGEFISRNVLLAIGRRGTPRKLGVKGEGSEKVYYRLLEPELIKKQKVLVVGGGDSAIEAALLIADENNKVTLSYRNNSFNRIKPGNYEKINSAIIEKRLNVLYNTNVNEITADKVKLLCDDGSIIEIDNDLVYVFAGGELPNEFLRNAGISITKKYGEVVLKH